MGDSWVDLHPIDKLHHMGVPWGIGRGFLFYKNTISGIMEKPVLTGSFAEGTNWIFAGGI